MQNIFLSKDDSITITASVKYLNTRKATDICRWLHNLGKTYHRSGFKERKRSTFIIHCPCSFATFIDFGDRSRYLRNVEVITSHRVLWVLLLSHCVHICFWHQSTHMLCNLFLSWRGPVWGSKWPCRPRWSIFVWSKLSFSCNRWLAPNDTPGSHNRRLHLSCHIRKSKVCVYGKWMYKVFKST